ncbi:ArsR family transcriptional regulator [Cytobacillus firmus]|uniref:ArsR family transcriptional regulator n=2 Tax=Cytobacillus TaxID=2675230 RepID=A0A366JQ67_CYTFI|nr:MULTISPECIES: metalloregulator ArsR/SmtB family transcription factor [Cytobacillus]RBP88762.1 ArsR family transcriptional regulator [Cytobacillus firmus]TDX39547.1 ArsR family transcriptional regulator [Cytobacillus oceanisediminis]
MSQKAIDVFRACIPLFHALSDPARQDIIILLAENDALSVNEIAQQSNLSRPAISHHLKVMRDNDLVLIEQKGTQRFYTLSIEQGVEQLKKLIQIVESECIL